MLVWFPLLEHGIQTPVSRSYTLNVGSRFGLVVGDPK